MSRDYDPSIKMVQTGENVYIVNRGDPKKPLALIMRKPANTGKWSVYRGWHSDTRLTAHEFDAPQWALQWYRLYRSDLLLTR